MKYFTKIFLFVGELGSYHENLVFLPGLKPRSLVLPGRTRFPQRPTKPYSLSYITSYLINIAQYNTHLNRIGKMYCGNFFPNRGGLCLY